MDNNDWDTVIFAAWLLVACGLSALIVVLVAICGHA